MIQYAAPVFLGAFLLFQVQPLIARCILPWFGGSPAVWTTCMLFFQVVLLLGYAYAHLVASRLRPGRQVLAHAALLSAALGAVAWTAHVWGAPIIPSPGYKPPDANFPVARILWLLTIAVGLPYFVLATTSPMLQAWFSRTYPGVSPYRLYTLSNAGSLLALLSYPVIVEPNLALRAQAAMWAWVFVAFVAACAVCAARVWRTCPAREEETLDGAPGACELPEEAPPSRRRRMTWIALPALASVLLLAMTNHLCQEVAVIPFLWVLPLSLYLLTFIICFDSPRWYSRRFYVAALAACMAATVLVTVCVERMPLVVQIGVYSLTLFVGCMLCHGELVALKPSPRYLTAFYLAVSIGGALGGVLVGLVAPLVFRGYWELYVSMFLCCHLGRVLLRKHPDLWPRLGERLSFVLAAAGVCALVLPVVAFAQGAAQHGLVVRNFYGVLRVEEHGGAQSGDRRFTLVHGRTTHGYQFVEASKRRVPTSYYGENSGVGLALLNHPRRVAGDGRVEGLRIGVVGLGVGTLATYCREGDYMRFYDINPAVMELAKDERYFTFLRDCAGRTDIVLGDGRISLERELAQGPQDFDLLVLDAFSSDAIPAHLLTREAFELYLAHLRRPDGLIAVHVSNRALDLPQVVRNAAENLGLAWAFVPSPAVGQQTLPAEWMLLAADPALLCQPAIAAASAPLPNRRRTRLWTDDYYNLFQILK